MKMIDVVCVTEDDDDGNSWIYLLRVNHSIFVGTNMHTQKNRIDVVFYVLFWKELFLLGEEGRIEK